MRKGRVYQLFRGGFIGLGRGFKYFGLNARFAPVPLFLVFLGLCLYLLLSGVGIAMSMERFASQGNELLISKGLAPDLPYPTFLDVLRLDLSGSGPFLANARQIESLGKIDEGLTKELNALAQKTVEVAALLSGIGTLITVLFYLASTFVTGFVIKWKRGIPYGFKYTLISLVLKFVIFAGLVYGLGYLFALVPVVGSILSAILIPMVESLFSLYRGYLVQNRLRRSGRMFAFVSFRDVLIFLALTWSLYLGVILTAVAAFVLAGEYDVLALSVFLSLLSFVTSFLDVYAEKYVLDKAERLRRSAEKERQAAEAHPGEARN